MSLSSESESALWCCSHWQPKDNNNNNNKRAAINNENWAGVRWQLEEYSKMKGKHNGEISCGLGPLATHCGTATPWPRWPIWLSWRLREYPFISPYSRFHKETQEAKGATTQVLEVHKVVHLGGIYFLCSMVVAVRMARSISAVAVK